MTPKERAVMQQALEALEELHYSSGTVVAAKKYESATAALREALDHSGEANEMVEFFSKEMKNKISVARAEQADVKESFTTQFIPVGIVNDQHCITWMEEIVDDQAPIGAILYALQDSVGRNVSFADETVCNWRQPTYDHSDANYWDADCGKSWAITEGTPTENGMKFCHGCGKPIKEHPFVDSEEQK